MDDHTDEATARYRTLIARKLRPEKEIEGGLASAAASSKPQRKSAIVIKKQRADALDITPEEQQRRVDAAALFREVVRRTNARAKKK